MARPLFAVINPDGDVEGLESTESAAIQAAGRLAPEVQVERQPDKPVELGRNLSKIAAEDMPAEAFKACGVPMQRFEDVMSMSLEEAWKEIVDLFPKMRPPKGADLPETDVAAWDTPKSMSRRILGQNYKTSKKTNEKPSNVQGLSLLPFSMVRMFTQQTLPRKMKTLCFGSTGQCQKACLVYAGHNMIDVYNTLLKTAKTDAFLLHPRAFCRMLVENVRHHADKRRRSPVEPFVRLNVFSDVPWEQVIPGIFEAFPSLAFYDYTKVPARRVPKNYDITFSYSGENADHVQYEIDRGHRIAVVFVPPVGFKKAKEVPAGEPCPPGFVKGYAGKCYSALPKRFLGNPGLEVVDGDVSDIRPRDPAPCVVGLRWKVPVGNVGTKSETLKSFVVPIELVGDVMVAAVTGSRTGIGDIGGANAEADDE